MAPPPGSSRPFSNSAAGYWQRPYSRMLVETGPKWPWHKDAPARSKVNMSATNQTQQMPLPLALKRTAITSFDFPDLSKASNLSQKDKDTGKIFGPNVPDPLDQTQVKNEGDVVSIWNQFLVPIAEQWARVFLKAEGYNGRLRSNSEDSSNSATPDVVWTYQSGEGEKAYTVFVLDYKGPHCIFEEEIVQSCVQSPEEAHKLIAAHDANPERKRGKEKSAETLALEKDNPSVMWRVNKNLACLLKQGVKYARTHLYLTNAVAFCDPETFAVIHVPKNLQHENEELMKTEVYTEKEIEKSTEEKPVKKAHNHVAVLTWHLVRAVKEHVKALEEKKKLEASKKPEEKKKSDDKKNRTASPSGSGRPPSSHKK